MDESPANVQSERSTRHRLLELAAKAFATSGYPGVSVRDLARELGVTTGAIYAHFKTKGHLLSQVIDDRVQHDMEELPTPTTFPIYLRNVVLHHTERRQMRALFLEAAAASRTDPEVKERLRISHQLRLQSWIVEYERWQTDAQVDTTIDVATLTKMLWASEVGLGILEAIGLDNSNPIERAKIYERFLAALEHSRPRALPSS